MMFLFLGIAVGAGVAVIARGSQQNERPTSTTWKTPWSYEGERGPEHWGDLDPEYAPCKDGHAQSPIDIRETEKADLPALRSITRAGR